MQKQWKHPRLGEFAVDGKAWRRKLNVPAFAAFSYDTGYSNAKRSTGDIAFSFSPWLSNEKLDAPTPGMIAVAMKIFDDPEATVQKVIAALWEDFNGGQRDSGHWWHGNMEQIRAAFEEEGLPPLTRAQDLLNVLQLYDVAVFDKSFEAPDPIAWLTFHAAFEQEHGLSILSNGDDILGAGYCGEATPWKTKQNKPRKKPTNPFGNGGRKK